MDSKDESIVEEYFKFAQDLAKKVGVIIKEAFYSEKAIVTKSCATDLVTETDQKVEEIILSSINEKYPDHKFIGEESVAGGSKCVLTDDPTWIVDPIDGTTNFVHRFPYVAVCIGFVWRKQRLMGIVYNPILDEMYYAKRGKGAFRNDVRLLVSKEKDISKSLVMTEMGSSREKEHLDKVFKNLRSILCIPIHGIHSLGSAACNICMVATGAAEAYYEYGIHCWDYCAASIIVEEAGGVIVDTNCGPVNLMGRRLIAANNIEVARGISEAIVEDIQLPSD